MRQLQERAFKHNLWWSVSHGKQTCCNVCPARVTPATSGRVGRSVGCRKTGSLPLYQNPSRSPLWGGSCWLACVQTHICLSTCFRWVRGGSGECGKILFFRCCLLLKSLHFTHKLGGGTRWMKARERRGGKMKNHIERSAQSTQRRYMGRARPAAALAAAAKTVPGCAFAIRDRRWQNE